MVQLVRKNAAVALQELSIAVPLANGLTFLFTSIAGQCLGEHPASRRNVIFFLFTKKSFVFHCYFYSPNGGE